MGGGSGITSKTYRASLTASGGAVAGGKFTDPGRKVYGLMWQVFVKLGTATAVAGLTIENADGMDLLNGQGAASITADTIHDVDDIGGLMAKGELTIAASTVSPSTGTFEVVAELVGAMHGGTSG